MDKRYIENEKKRTTACIITNQPTVTDKLTKKDATLASLITLSERQHTEASKFIGIAKRHPLDASKPTIGRHIASSKADLAYHKAMAKDLKDIKETLMKEVAIIEALEDHELKMINKTEAFIEFLKR